VVLLVIDALEGVTEQDQRLAGRIEEEGRACIIVVNKWDAVEKDTYTINEYTREIRERLYFIDWAPLLFVSALTGQRTHKIFAEVNTAVAAHRKRIPTSVVNEVLQEALAWQSPPANRQGRQGKIYYGTQIAEQPPTFLLFVNDPDLFKENYRRYLEKHFRQNLDFAGTPLRFVWRGKSERRVAQEVRKLEGSLASP
jgi:GTP-binding protein